MELSELTTSELLEEINKRDAKENDVKEKESGDVLVLGTMCEEHGNHFVEVFKEIESEKDLDFYSSACMRARINSQRKYKVFYFKTNKFKKLAETLDKESKKNKNSNKFVKWINKTKAVKVFDI